MKNMFICNKEVKSRVSGIPLGTRIAFSPVGSGIFNEITDAGYPRINSVAVTAFLTEHGIVYGDFREFIIHKLLEPYKNKNDYRVVFSYTGLDGGDYYEGTGSFSDIKFPESADHGLYWNAVCELKPTVVQTTPEEPVDPASFQYLKNMAEVLEKNRASNPIDIVDLHAESEKKLKARLERANEIATDTYNSIMNDAKLSNEEKLIALKDQIACWIESAAQFHSNEQFYHGIVTQIGEMFGEAAKTSDDGSVQQDVLALKVPELVKELKEKNDQFKTRLLSFIKSHS